MQRHRLILVRHAKSSWNTPALRDHDRPLNKRGYRSSRLVGTFLRESAVFPDEVLLSTARRCVETWDGIRKVVGIDVPIRREADLYHSSAAGMLEFLRTANGGTVLMIGHNPGIAALATGLVKSAAGHTDFRRYPTAATTIIDFEIDSWKHASAHTGTLVDFRIPRELET